MKSSGCRPARARKSAEYAEHEYEYELIDDCNARHLLRADKSDHDIIQKRHEVGYYILNEDRNHYGKKPAVKRPVAYEFFKHKFNLRLR